MPEAKMTSKGQITVPAEVRRRLGLRAGSRVDYSGPARTPAEMDDAIAEGAAQSMRS